MAARTTRAGWPVPFRATSQSSCTARANPACHTRALGSCRPALGESIVRVTLVDLICPLTYLDLVRELGARTKDYHGCTGAAGCHEGAGWSARSGAPCARERVVPGMLRFGVRRVCGGGGCSGRVLIRVGLRMAGTLGALVQQTRGGARAFRVSRPVCGMFDGLKDQWNQSKDEYMGKKEQEIFQVRQLRRPRPGFAVPAHSASLTVRSRRTGPDCIPRQARKVHAF